MPLLLRYNKVRVSRGKVHVIMLHVGSVPNHFSNSYIQEKKTQRNKRYDKVNIPIQESW